MQHLMLVQTMALFLVLGWLFVAVKSNGEFSLTNLPDKGASIVTKESTLDVQKLVTSFQRLGSHAELAYYSTVAYQTAEFSDKARSIHNDVSILKKNSISTFNKFEEKSNLAKEKLQTAFEHISKTEQDEARPLIKDVGDQAKEMAVEASTLYSQADAQLIKVRTLLDEINSNRGNREQERVRIEKEQKELSAQKARYEAERQGAERAAADLAKQAEQARRDADHEKKKKKKKCKGLLGKLKCKLASAVNWNIVKKYEKREKSLRQEAASHTAKAKEQQNKAAHAIKQIQQTTNSLNEARSKIKSIEDTAAGLKSLVTEYLGLTVALGLSNTFWNDMVSRCEDLMPEEYYTSPEFQDKAIKLYIRWLSLNSDSRLFVTQVKPMASISSTKPSVTDAQKKIKTIKDEL